MTNSFHAYDTALALVGALKPVLEALAQTDRALEDQLRRAESSVVLNLAEGSRRFGKDRIHFFRIAAGSAAEVSGALDVARVAHEIEIPSGAVALLDRVLAMTWRLARGPGR
jgi:four helix bundle protein